MSVEQSQGKSRKLRLTRWLLIVAAIIINLGVIAFLVNQVIHKNWLDRGGKILGEVKLKDFFSKL